MNLLEDNLDSHEAFTRWADDKEAELKALEQDYLYTVNSRLDNIKNGYDKFEWTWDN